MTRFNVICIIISLIIWIQITFPIFSESQFSHSCRTKYRGTYWLRIGSLTYKCLSSIISAIMLEEPACACLCTCICVYVPVCTYVVCSRVCPCSTSTLTVILLVWICKSILVGMKWEFTCCTWGNPSPFLPHPKEMQGPWPLNSAKGKMLPL